MTTVRQVLPEPTPPRPPATPRQRLGLALIVLGLAGILWGVFHVLGAIGGYEGREFSHRKPDSEVRAVVHRTFPGALARSLAGLALVLAGGRLRRSGASSG
jgi:hypothetical protein